MRETEKRYWPALLLACALTATVSIAASWLIVRSTASANDEALDGRLPIILEFDWGIAELRKGRRELAVKVVNSEGVRVFDFSASNSAGRFVIRGGPSSSVWLDASSGGGAVAVSSSFGMCYMIGEEGELVMGINAESSDASVKFVLDRDGPRIEIVAADGKLLWSAP